MKKYKKHEIICDLMTKWFNDELRKTSIDTVISISPSYNFIVNTLLYPDFNKNGDIKILREVSEEFCHDKALHEKGDYNEFRESLFDKFMTEYEGKIFTETLNGVVRYGTLDSCKVRTLA